MTSRFENVVRSAPRWAWDVIEETLRMDAQSGAFSPELRRKIANALEAVTDGPGESECVLCRTDERRDASDAKALADEFDVTARGEL